MSKTKRLKEQYPNMDISIMYYNDVKTNLINRVPLTNPKRKAEVMKKY